MKVKVNDQRNVPGQIPFRDLDIGDYFLDSEGKLCIKLHDEGTDTEFYNTYNNEDDTVCDTKDETFVQMVLVEINVIKDVYKEV